MLPAIEGDELIESAAKRYASADPQEVADELEAQASGLAQAAADAGSATWDRGITVGDSRSSVRRLLEHALHDSQHHLADVERGFHTLRS